MVANVTVDAKLIARELAAAIRDELVVKQLWLAHEQDDVELFVITAGATLADERRIADAFTDLIVRHQEANIRPRSFDPRYFVNEAAFRAALPERAVRVPLHG